MAITWDRVLEYYSRNKVQIEAEARAELHRGISARAITAQHWTYIQARQHSSRTDAVVPLLDRLADRLRLIDRYQK